MNSEVIVAATLYLIPPPGTLAAGIAAGGTFALTQGLFERYIRRRALARRSLPDAADRAMRLAERTDPEDQANDGESAA